MRAARAVAEPRLWARRPNVCSSASRMTPPAAARVSVTAALLPCEAMTSVVSLLTAAPWQPGAHYPEVAIACAALHGACSGAAPALPTVPSWLWRKVLPELLFLRKVGGTACQHEGGSWGSPDAGHVSAHQKREGGLVSWAPRHV